MMRARRVVVAWMLALAAAFGAAAQLAQAAEVGDVIHLPDVKLLDGRTVPASQWAGKPLVVEIWASWCPFCALPRPGRPCTTRRAARRCGADDQHRQAPA
jgi:thiol-disulfide isomerase/thioredoxin